MPTTFEEAYGRRPAKLGSVKLVDFTTLKDLPESHSWESLDDIHNYPVINEPIPLIDFNQDDDLILPQVARACRDLGAFQLIGHEIPLDLLDRVETQCKRLFAVPIESKHVAARRGNMVSGFSTPFIGKHFSKALWAEGFTMARSLKEDAQMIWPNDHHQFCEVFEEYKERLKQVATRLVRLLFTSLGSTLDESGWPPMDQTSPVLHANWYPPCPDPSRAMGLAAHTDTSLITFLYQINQSGLQLMRPWGELRPTRWVPVPVTPGALVVNLGDLFHVVSNGRYRSALHRAVVNKNFDRYSIVCFVGPPCNVKVSPLKCLVENEGEMVHGDVTWSELVALKLDDKDVFVRNQK